MKKFRLLFLVLLSLVVFSSCEDDKTPEGNAVFGFGKVAETVAETVTTLSVPILVAEGTAPTEWPITFDITVEPADVGVMLAKSTDLTITEANNTVMELTLALDNETSEENRVYTFTIENVRGDGVTLDDGKKSFVLTVTNEDGNAVFGFSEVAETVEETATTLSVPIVVAAETAPTEWPITFDIALTVAEGGSKDGVTITKAKDLTITEANNTVMELTLALDNDVFEEDRVYTFTIENVRGDGVTLDNARKTFVLTVTNDDPEEGTIPEITANSFIVALSGEITVPINNVNVFWNKGGDGAIAIEMGDTWSQPNLEAPAVTANLIFDDTYVAEVIWTDIAEGVDVTFTKTKDNFTVSGIPATAGNIVVGVKKSADATDYLWSWHLWVMDFDPNTSTATLPSGLVAMDRNLGATNATAGDVGALGLMYQWGRKDPFPGADGILSNNVRPTYPTVLPEAVKDGTGTLLSVIGNPNVFYGAETINSDAINTGHLSGDKGYSRWGGATSHTDITAIKGVKSIYDPCPEGWRMPWGEDWSGFTTTNLTEHADGWDTNPGRIYTDTNGKIIWLPAAGYLNFFNGALYRVGLWGSYWSGSPNSSRDGYYLYFYSSDVGSSYTSRRAGGYTVRPVKDVP